LPDRLPDSLVSLVIDVRPSVLSAADGQLADWPYDGGNRGGTRYSPLTQINGTNVAQLKVAWEYHTGDQSDGTGGRRVSAFETTPIVAYGTMYFSTPFNRVITGKEK